MLAAPAASTGLRLQAGARCPRGSQARPARLGSARLGQTSPHGGGQARGFASDKTGLDGTGLDWLGSDWIGSEGCELRAKSRELREASNGQQRAAGAC